MDFVWVIVRSGEENGDCAGVTKDSSSIVTVSWMLEWSESSEGGSRLRRQEKVSWGLTAASVCRCASLCFSSVLIHHWAGSSFCSKYQRLTSVSVSHHTAILCSKLKCVFSWKWYLLRGTCLKGEMTMPLIFRTPWALRETREQNSVLCLPVLTPNMGVWLTGCLWVFMWILTNNLGDVTVWSLEPNSMHLRN